VNPPGPKKLSGLFRLIIGGVLFIGAAIFFVALHDSHGTNFANIKENRDGWWLHQKQPTPTPTPKAVATPMMRPILIQAPPRAVPHPQPSICQICLERAQRYRMAIQTGMGGAGGRVRDLPQVVTNPNVVPTPPMNIFAYQQQGEPQP
jgi:hypothetical protein